LLDDGNGSKVVLYEKRIELSSRNVIAISLIAGLLINALLFLLFSVNVRLGGITGEIAAGSIIGMLFALLSQLLRKPGVSWWSLSLAAHRHRNRLASIDIVLGGILFLIAALIGSGVVFGIDFNKLLSSVSGISYPLAALLGGGIFGLFMGFGDPIDYGLPIDGCVDLGLVTFFAASFIFIGSLITALFATPFILAAVLVRIIMAFVLSRFPINRIAIFRLFACIVALVVLIPIAFASR
jgi:hypothetical protein